AAPYLAVADPDRLSITFLNMRRAVAQRCRQTCFPEVSGQLSQIHMVVTGDQFVCHGHAPWASVPALPLRRPLALVHTNGRPWRGSAAPGRMMLAHQSRDTNRVPRPASRLWSGFTQEGHRTKIAHHEIRPSRNCAGHGSMAGCQGW